MDTSEWMPAGFVPLADFDHRSRGRGDGHSAEYKQLREAFRQKKIPGLQTGGERGRVYVHEQSAKQYLADCVIAESAKTEKPARTVSGFPAETSIEVLVTALVELCKSHNALVAQVERLADAVEAIATQPKTPQQELMHAIGSNGFHS